MRIEGGNGYRGKEWEYRGGMRIEGRNENIGGEWE